MNKYWNVLIKTLKICIVMAVVGGSILFALYPVKNQNVTVIVDTGTETISQEFSVDQIEGMTEFSVPVSDSNVEEIRLCRRFKSICVDKIQKSDFDKYLFSADGSIVFNEFACDMMRRQSKSFLLERIIYIEGLCIIALFFWILLHALEEKLNGKYQGNHGPIHEIWRFIGDLIKYKEYVVFAAQADLKAEVANSYLNRLWWLLEPLFNMLVYVIVFGRIMGNSIQNYATFVFSALLMWNFFSKTINYSVKCVRGNRDIVTKVYVPKHILLISNMILNFFKLLFSLIVLIPMLIIFHVPVGIHALWLVSAYLVMILLSFGIGMIFLHYGVYIDDLSYAVGILLQMTMFLSGIFYDVVTGLSVPLNVMMLSVNPVAMFLDTMRNALLGNYVSNVPLIGIWILLSLLLCYIGVHIVYKNENGYVKVV